MKMMCDVCNREAASLFCCADEASLCEACDQRVHHANKLAGKHQRFSLYQPSSSKKSPLCDICMEKRAFLFCQEDRAILCQDCDIQIHTSNDLIAKHNRFFLTGIKLLAPSPTNYQPLVESSVKVAAPNIKQPKEKGSPVLALVPGDSPVAIVPDNCNGQSQMGGTTSISDYLIKSIPGWHVEELLDNVGSGFTDPFAFPSVNGLLKTNEMLQDPNFGCDFGYGGSEPHTQAFQVPNVAVIPPAITPGDAYTNGRKRQMNTTLAEYQRDSVHLKAPMLYADDGFTVPQIGPPLKRATWR